jgi:type IV pilus assembly protein PilM
VRSTGSRSSIERWLGLEPQPVPPHAFALDEGALRGASFRRDRGALVLRELHELALPAGALAPAPLGGAVGDAEALGRAVAELVRRFAEPPKQASLVLPDLWARAAAVELGSLPEKADLREEILRFRLRKLVPFRVEELRLEAAPIAPVAGQEDPIRALVLYAAEAVCAGFERAFEAAGVGLGQITSSTLARLRAVSAAGGRDGRLEAVATVEPAGFALVFARGGEPVAWRQKAFVAGLDEAERTPLLAAELRLTRTFLDERLGGDPLERVVLAAPPEVAAYWTAVLADGLEVPVVPLATAHLPLAGATGAAGAAELAALAGAALAEAA